MTRKKNAGFTLIELLVVIGILAVLLAIVLIAINPARQFSQANNAKRSSDVNALLNAIHQYGADNKGNLSALNIPATATVIEIGAFADLCNALVPTYIAALPVDPLTDNGTPVSDCTTAGWSTNYEVSQSATNNRITVSAPATEIPPATAIISVLR